MFACIQLIILLTNSKWSLGSRHLNCWGVVFITFCVLSLQLSTFICGIRCICFRVNCFWMDELHWKEFYKTVTIPMPRNTDFDVKKIRINRSLQYATIIKSTSHPITSNSNRSHYIIVNGWHRIRCFASNIASQTNTKTFANFRSSLIIYKKVSIKIDLSKWSSLIEYCVYPIQWISDGNQYVSTAPEMWTFNWDIYFLFERKQLSYEALRIPYKVPFIHFT